LIPTSSHYNNGPIINKHKQILEVAETAKISLPVKQHLDSHSTRFSNLSPLQAPYQGLYAANIRIMNKNLKLARESHSANKTRILSTKKSIILSKIKYGLP